MAHISPVGRGSWKVRTGLGALYAVLIAGAITTLYPFLLMVSTATKSQVDYNDYSPQALVPRYLRDDRALYVKYVEDRYANNIDDINAAHHADYAKTAEVLAPTLPDSDKTRALVTRWNSFVQTLPLTTVKAGFGEHDNAPSRLLLRYRDHVRQEFTSETNTPRWVSFLTGKHIIFSDGGNIDALNKAWTEENVSFDGVTPPFERTGLRSWNPNLSQPKVRDWYEFKKTLPAEFRLVTFVDPLYRTFLRQDIYEDDLKKLNAAWGTAYTDWNTLTLPRTVAEVPVKARTDWEKFIRTKYPLRFLTVQGAEARAAWQAFLSTRNRTGATTADLPTALPSNSEALTDWMDFVSNFAPVGSLEADTPENGWRSALEGEYPTIAAANAAYGTSWKDWSTVPPPQPEADNQFARAHSSALRTEFAGRNFRSVAGYIFLHGRAVGNTVAFCLLAIAAAVIINPMCAYALSRYPLPYAYKVLLFLLATMAFPAEVAMIPNFLLLRDLHLLNTFAALVLPGLASGFSIFLLKGFFDSLPKELYEAGILDGATEITMFRRITVPLSLPIFSVIALNAFTASYGAFLFAMVTCQDPKMWTLMVWLYNLQDSAPQYVIMAALTLAALPTLLVFLLAQKVIMRGIILPSFK